MMRGAVVTVLVVAAAILVVGCAGGGAARFENAPADDAPTSFLVPASLTFVAAHRNERGAPYYPLEGLAGLAFDAEGVLYVCDQLGGRIHGWEMARDLWYQFDAPGGRGFRPVAVGSDGFHVLALDFDSREFVRFDRRGIFLDRLIDFTYFDTGFDRVPSDFDVDVDGSIALCDAQENQVVVLDGYLEPRTVFGSTGSHREQFREPSGIVVLPDGGFAVSDRGNRRVQVFNRIGSLTGTAGGEFDVHNPMITPQGIDCDRWGNLFVADPAAGKIHVYDRDLRHLFSAGSELGLTTAPVNPMDVALGPDGLLAVTDRGQGQAVLLYRIQYR